MTTAAAREKRNELWAGMPVAPASPATIGLRERGPLMRILFATDHTYLPQRFGGAESSTHDLCTYLLKKNHEVLVLAKILPWNRTWLANRVRGAIGRHPCPADRIMGYPVHRGWDLQKGFEAIASSAKLDAVVAMAECAYILPKAVERGVGAFLYLRDVEFTKRGFLDQARLTTDGKLSALGRSIDYIANSDFVARYFADAYGVAPTTITPLIHLDKYRTTVAPERVLSMCLHPLKGDDLAFRLAERCRDLPFEFRQSWPIAEPSWQAYAERSRKLGNVALLRPTHELKELYRHARVLLVPSRWREAYGRVVAEAQANGIPVIATDIGGLPESVGPGGLLVPPDAPVEQWEDALRRLWTDQALYRDLSDKAVRHAHRAEAAPDALVEKLLATLAAPGRRPARDAKPG